MVATLCLVVDINALSTYVKRQVLVGEAGRCEGEDGVGVRVMESDAEGM